MISARHLYILEQIQKFEQIQNEWKYVQAFAINTQLL
jgi:hypothetical protein